MNWNTSLPVPLSTTPVTLYKPPHCRTPRTRCALYYSSNRQTTMPLTAEQGYKIREEYSDIKEKAVCDAHGLTQIGGSRTKIDGANAT